MCACVVCVCMCSVCVINVIRVHLCLCAFFSRVSVQCAVGGGGDCVWVSSKNKTITSARYDAC